MSKAWCWEDSGDLPALFVSFGVTCTEEPSLMPPARSARDAWRRRLLLSTQGTFALHSGATGAAPREYSSQTSTTALPQTLDLSCVGVLTRAGFVSINPVAAAAVAFHCPPSFHCWLLSLAREVIHFPAARLTLLSSQHRRILRRISLIPSLSANTERNARVIAPFLVVCQLSLLLFFDFLTRPPPQLLCAACRVVLFLARGCCCRSLALALARRAM